MIGFEKYIYMNGKPSYMYIEIQYKTKYNYYILDYNNCDYKRGLVCLLAEKMN